MDHEDFEPRTILKDAGLMLTVVFAISAILFVLALLLFIFGPAYA